MVKAEEVLTGKQKAQAARVVLGIVLLMLLTGLWAYLWVPPLP